MDDQHYILTCIIKNKSIASWNEDHKLIIRGDDAMVVYKDGDKWRVLYRYTD